MKLKDLDKYLPRGNIVPEAARKTCSTGPIFTLFKLIGQKRTERLKWASVPIRWKDDEGNDTALSPRGEKVSRYKGRGQ